MTLQRSPLRLCAAIVVIAGCAAAPPPHQSQLDGPIEYTTGSGFFGYASQLRVELDGSASRTVTTSPAPGQPTTTTVTTGTVSPAVLDQLRADVAAVDLASLRESYTCDQYGCNNADLGGSTLEIAADGMIAHISVDSSIPAKDLPPGLVQLLEDVKAIDLPPP